LDDDYRYQPLRVVISRSLRVEGPADLTYLIVSPPFAEYEEGALYEAFLGLLGHDTETPWAHDGYRLEEKRASTEWGASGFVWSILLEVGAHVPDAVIGYGLGRTLDSLVARLRLRRELPSLDRAEALRRAQYTLVLNTPDLRKADLLEPYTEEEDRQARQWSFTFRPGNGNEYVVIVGTVGGVPGVTCVKRARLD
jgi:hypothetical protein